MVPVYPCEGAVGQGDVAGYSVEPGHELDVAALLPEPEPVTESLRGQSCRVLI